ncbi:MAG: hypothetical protein AAFV95_03175 [Bacteroidota bacterium]
MKTKSFNNRLEAIDWIAENAENEGQFEVMREQLNFNFIYHHRFFLRLDELDAEVIMLDHGKKPRG